MTKQPSDDCLELLKSIEKLSLFPYDDRTGKRVSDWSPKATIGYGHLIRQGEWSKWGRNISQTEAEELFQLDAESKIEAVNNTLVVEVSQQVFDACVILTFNIGATGFRTSSVAKLLNGLPGSHYKTLDDAWMAWDQSDGGDNPGLRNRRRCELQVLHHNVFERW